MLMYKEKTHTYNELVGSKCDICGAETNNGNNWSNERYNQNETKVEHRQGDVYPDGSFGKTYSTEICPICFETKLIPFLKSLGSKVEYEEWDF